MSFSLFLYLRCKLFSQTSIYNESNATGISNTVQNPSIHFFPCHRLCLSCCSLTLNLCPFYLFLSNPVLSPSYISSFLLTPAPSPSLCAPPSFTLSGRLYNLLNQYSSLVCKNCRTTRPDVSLYSFIYEKVSSHATVDALDSAKDSGMSPVTSDSH